MLELCHRPGGTVRQPVPESNEGLPGAQRTGGSRGETKTTGNPYHAPGLRSAWRQKIFDNQAFLKYIPKLVLRKISHFLQVSR
jgi:hypothetical protein